MDLDGVLGISFLMQSLPIIRRKKNGKRLAFLVPSVCHLLSEPYSIAR